VHKGFRWGDVTERGHLEDKIRMDLREVKWRVMDRIYLAQDRDRWRALVNAVMNLWVL
jgi:hypothetical protein